MCARFPPNYISRSARLIPAHNCCSVSNALNCLVISEAWLILVCSELEKKDVCFSCLYYWIIVITWLDRVNRGERRRMLQRRVQSRWLSVSGQIFDWLTIAAGDCRELCHVSATFFGLTGCCSDVKYLHCPSNWARIPICWQEYFIDIRLSALSFLCPMGLILSQVTTQTGDVWSVNSTIIQSGFL